MSSQRHFNRRTNPPRRPNGVNGVPFRETDPTRHGPLSPPTRYPLSAMGPDEMDIDPSLPAPPAPKNVPATTQAVQHIPWEHIPGIYRHTLEIDLSNRPGGMTDAKILEHARTQLLHLEQANMSPSAMRRVRDCRMRLRIDIDTKSASRAGAVINIRMRMLAMEDMITRFSSIPYRA